MCTCFPLLYYGITFFSLQFYNKKKFHRGTLKIKFYICMKTINLKTIKDGLSRNEMRNVKGGCGYGITCDKHDTCGPAGGYYNNFQGGGGQLNCCSK